MKALRAAKREDLRTRLIDAAEARIGRSGLTGLRARDITADAGCALGALYTAFADLDELVFHVNSRTMARLEASLRAKAAQARDPKGTLKGLAQAYLSFARQNRTLWTALFEHRKAPGATVPDWNLAEQAALIQHLVEPLSMLSPTLDQADLLSRARTLFSAVHGIVAISLEERFIGLSPSSLDSELDHFVDVLAAGIEKVG